MFIDGIVVVTPTIYEPIFDGVFAFTYSSHVDVKSIAERIILLDHAPESLWKDLPNIKLVDEWRGGKKLVPLDWINKDK